MNLIYKVTNLVNNKIYIGQTTTSLNQRKKEHEYRALRGDRNTYFYSALKSYGFDKFKWEILEENINFQDLNLREEYWINYYNSNNFEFGYNMTKGGDNADNLNKWRQQNPELASAEAYKGWEKMKNILLEHPEIEEKRKENSKKAIQKYTKEHLNEIREKSYQTYLNHKDEQERTLAQARAKKMKKVRCIETNIVYPSINEAGRQTNNSPSNIKACCDGKRKSAGKDMNNNKLHWEYVINDTN